MLPASRPYGSGSFQKGIMRIRIAVLSCLVASTIAATLASFWGVDRFVAARLEVAVPAPCAEGSTAAARDAHSGFVPNVGQWHDDVRYLARFGAMTVMLRTDGWRFALVEAAEPSDPSRSASPRSRGRGVGVHMKFAGAGEARLEARHRLDGVHHYLLGNDPARWRTDVPRFGSVVLRDLFPGIEVEAYEDGGHFEFDLCLRPGAALTDVEIVVEGAERIFVDESGSLILATVLGPVCMPPPPSWETTPSGERRAVECRYELRGPDRFGFTAADRDANLALVVDPGLIWSTFLGGRATDRPGAVHVDEHGAVTVAGFTGSVDFPTTPGAFDTSFAPSWGGDLEAFVTRLGPAGDRLLWSTYLGGRDQDVATEIVVDQRGVTTVAGFTDSADFPSTPGAYRSPLGLGTAGFVTRLSATGSSLVWSARIGGSALWTGDMIDGLALDSRGAAVIVGSTTNTNFPTTARAVRTRLSGIQDAFVSRLSPDGAVLEYSTYLGGGADDRATAVAVDGADDIFVAGATVSADFPTTAGAFDSTLNNGGPGYDAFLTKLSASSGRILGSSFLGGSSYDEVSDLHVDAAEFTTVVGSTWSTDFPTTPGAFDTVHSGVSNNRDGFVTRFDPGHGTLSYSTFLGGVGDERLWALAVDSRGVATVAGQSAALDFPTTDGAWATLFRGGTTDGIVARLDPTGTSLLYSTYLGGSGSSTELVSDVALGSTGGVVVTGLTWSTDFPTTAGAWSTVASGSGEGFVTRLDMLPDGVTAYGEPSPGCAGLPVIGVTSSPRIGSTTFALTCADGTPGAMGGVLVGSAPLDPPTPIVGASLFLDPLGAAFFCAGAVVADVRGGAEFPSPIAHDPALRGVLVFAQFVWMEANGPVPCPPFGVAASNALRIEVR